MLPHVQTKQKKLEKYEKLEKYVKLKKLEKYEKMEKLRKYEKQKKLEKYKKLETPLEECLGILEKNFLDKNPIWARRKAARRILSKYVKDDYSKCGWCGYKHPKGQCWAKEATCYKCGKIGHLRSVCRSEPEAPQAGSRAGRIKVVRSGRVKVKPIDGKDKPSITEVVPEAGGLPTGRVAPLKKPTYSKVATLKKLLTKVITDILDDSIGETDLEEETQKALEEVDAKRNEIDLEEEIQKALKEVDANRNETDLEKETQKALEEVDANQSKIGALNEQASKEMVSSNSEGSFRRRRPGRKFSFRRKRPGRKFRPVMESSGSSCRPDVVSNRSSCRT